MTLQGESGSNTTVKMAQIIWAVLCTAFVVVLYWPVFRWMIGTWLSSDYYSYGFLIVPLSIFFAWLKRGRLTERSPSILAVPAAILGIFLYSFSFWSGLRILGGLSLICVLAAIVLGFLGVKSLRILAFPIALLVFMLPLPFINEIVYFLQAISVHASSWALERLGFPISTSGAVINLKGMSFTIGLVCSGIDTLLALLALGAVFAHILKGSIIKRLGLFILALPLAILGNTLRITSIISVAYFVDLQAAMGWYHGVSSAIFFLFSFLVLVLAARVLRCNVNYGLFGRA